MKNDLKQNKKIKLSMIIGFVAILFIVIGIVITLVNKDNDNLIVDPSESNVFTIENNGLYGIFDSNGKQITDFKFKDVTQFLNNSAVVTDQNGKKGIINSNGKMVVEFGKYNFIFKEGYLYRCIDNDRNEFLLNANGEIVYNLGDNDVESYSITKEIVIVTGDNLIDVLDYKGNSIIKFSDNNSYKLSEKKENLVLFSHNNVVYIIDIFKGKIINKINSSESYFINSVNPQNGEQYVLGNKDSSTEELTYYDLSTKKFSKPDSVCSNLFFESSGAFICATNSYQRYLIDENGNQGVEFYKNNNLEYIDNKNYIDLGESGVEFYVNGKLVNTVSKMKPSIVASRQSKIYLLYTSSSYNRTYSYYSYKGEKLYGKDFKNATKFDKNGITRVSDDGNTYYLMNIDGKQISNSYDDITSSFDTFRENKFYEAKNGTTNYILGIDGKEILSSSNRIYTYDNYIMTKENNSTKYYTYSGKLIFSK